MFSDFYEHTVQIKFIRSVLVVVYIVLGVIGSVLAFILILVGCFVYWGLTKRRILQSLCCCKFKKEDVEGGLIMGANLAEGDQLIKKTVDANLDKGERSIKETAV